MRKSSESLTVPVRYRSDSAPETDKSVSPAHKKTPPCAQPRATPRPRWPKSRGMSAPTIGKFIDIWLDDLERLVRLNERSRSTLRNYQCRAQHQLASQAGERRSRRLGRLGVVGLGCVAGGEGPTTDPDVTAAMLALSKAEAMRDEIGVWAAGDVHAASVTFLRTNLRRRGVGRPPGAPGRDSWRLQRSGIAEDVGRDTL